MPKSKSDASVVGFGERLAQLRKAAGFTQQELANEVGVSRRMIAYYEGQTEHPPTTLLPAIARALKLSTDALLGVAAAAKKSRGAKQADSRLVRRLQQIEKLDPADKRQVLQVLDAFIERGQLKRKMESRTS
jgi:transcriptional regulator with XRE-family HTH domain